MKKRTPDIEADLDPQGTRHTRPGGFAAEQAVVSTKPPEPAARESPRATGTIATEGRAVTDTPAPGTAPERRAPDPIEADLDPAGTTRTRPGGYAAAKAVEATKPRAKKR